MKRYLIFAAVGPFVGGFLLLFATTYMSGYWTQTNVGEVEKLDSDAMLHAMIGSFDGDESELTAVISGLVS